MDFPSVPIQLNLFEQVLLVGTAFVLKPFYMGLNLFYLVKFRRAQDPGVQRAWWALAWFLGGEICCGLNYFLHDTRYSWIQMTHDAGMVMTFALFSLTVLDVIDDRILQYSSPTRRCALLGVCRTCPKYRAGPCLLASSRKWLLGTLVLIFLLPLTIPIQPVRYETLVFGYPTVLEHGYLAQMVEIRLLPAVGVLLLALAAWLLAARQGRGRGPLQLAALALGPGGFSLMRVATAFPFLTSIVWMGFWEEATETAMVWLAGTWMGAWSARIESPACEPDAPVGRSRCSR